MSLSRAGTVALLVVLGAGLCIRIADDRQSLPRKPARAPVQIRTEETQPLNTDTVDLKNGNLHVQVPLPAVPKPKP